MSGSDATSEFEPMIVCGLMNIGNTCYFNSGLQCLANTAQFVTALRFCSLKTQRERERHSALRHSNPGRRALLSTALQTIDAMEFGEEPKLSPAVLLRALANLHEQFEGFSQQDCPEMVHALLQSLDDEMHIALDSSGIVESAPHAGECRASQRELQLFRLMDTVNNENEGKEHEARRRAGKAPDPAAFRPPRLLRSAVNDPFTGYSLSEVVCRACGATSRVIDAFTTLTVEIPTAKQRLAHRAADPEHARRLMTAAQRRQADAASRPQRSWNPLRLISRCLAAFFSFVCCCCGCGATADLGPLTLTECLDIHFSQEALRGANEYRCEVCGKTGEAAKRTSLLHMPEVLVLHLKRFEFGRYWNSKKHEHVEFPMDFEPAALGDDEGLAKLTASLHDDSSILDTTPYLASARPPLSPSKRCSSASPPPPAAAASAPHGVVGTYSLSSVVNHHGTFGGGHYTSFVRKGNHGWVLTNDSAISRVHSSEVADSQAYLLFYEKTPLVAREPEALQLRDRARAYLLNTVAMPDGVLTARDLTPLSAAADVCYVSKQWLQRCATYVEPGLLLNRMCYCAPVRVNTHLGPGGSIDESVFSSSGGARHFHCPAEWFYVPVLRADFDAFVRRYGGGPLVAHRNFTALLRKEQLWLTALLEHSVVPSSPSSTR